jgi:hypothetical protein
VLCGWTTYSALDMKLIFSSAREKLSCSIVVIPRTRVFVVKHYRACHAQKGLLHHKDLYHQQPV